MQDRACQFFQWVDPPMPQRAKVVIIGLLNKIDRMEKEEEKMKRMNTPSTRMKWILLWLLGALCIMKCLGVGI